MFTVSLTTGLVGGCTNALGLWFEGKAVNLTEVTSPPDGKHAKLIYTAGILQTVTASTLAGMLCTSNPITFAACFLPEVAVLLAKYFHEYSKRSRHIVYMYAAHDVDHSLSAAVNVVSKTVNTIAVAVIVSSTSVTLGVLVGCGFGAWSIYRIVFSRNESQSDFPLIHGLW